MVDKCQVLTSNDGQDDSDYVFYLRGNEIPIAQVEKDLGLIIDRKRSFDGHFLRTVKNFPFDELHL